MALYWRILFHNNFFQWQFFHIKKCKLFVLHGIGLNKFEFEYDDGPPASEWLPMKFPGHHIARRLTQLFKSDTQCQEFDCMYLCTATEHLIYIQSQFSASIDSSNISYINFELQISTCQ